MTKKLVHHALNNKVLVHHALSNLCKCMIKMKVELDTTHYPQGRSLSVCTSLISGTVCPMMTCLHVFVYLMMTFMYVYKNAL